MFILLHEDLIWYIVSFEQISPLVPFKFPSQSIRSVVMYIGIFKVIRHSIRVVIIWTMFDGHCCPTKPKHLQ